jgi:hypothetical protein
MLEKHTTTTGSTILIAEMEDSHLINMINLVSRKILELQNRLKTPSSNYQQVLYGLPKVNEETIAKAIREFIQKLYPYLAEAYLRGLTEPLVFLRMAVGREKALDKISAFPILTSNTRISNIVDWDAWDDEHEDWEDR